MKTARKIICLLLCLAMFGGTAVSAAGEENGNGPELVMQDGYLYLYDENGEALTGWQTANGQKYYFGTDGRALTGWQTIDGEKYYLSPSMMTGDLCLYNETTKQYEYYRLDADGKQQSGWVTVEEKDAYGNTAKRKYYYGSDGQRKSGWQTIDGETYYLNYAALTGFVLIADAESGTTYRYYFDQEGRMQTGLTDLGEDGVYFFDDKGRALTGWQKIGDAQYHFNEYSYYADTGLMWIDRQYYFFDDKGVMQTGWNDTGSMGWRLFDGKDGTMIQSFDGWGYVEIPAEVTEVTTNAFAGVGRDFVVYCEPGSYAEKFAKAAGLQYDNGKTRAVGYKITNVNEKVNWVVANYTDDSMSSLEKVLALHDWLVHNAVYDRTYSSYSANGVLVNGTGVCQSYAEATVLLLNAAGIECRLLSGSADNGSGNGAEGHAWNLVKLGDHWYHLDCTWDDPTNLREGEAVFSGMERYSYFLISDEEIGRNHFWSSSIKAPVSIAWTGDPGWAKVGGEWVYYSDAGFLVTGPTRVDGILYGFGEDGRLMIMGWHTVKGQYFYADAEGALLTDDWVSDGGEWYYLDEKGAMQTGWIEYDGDWYYLADDGAMQTGWIRSGNTWYLLKDDGALATGWAKDNGKWYYFNEDGIMQTGWIEDDGTWYYLTGSGEVKTGWFRDGNSWYLLAEDGAMITGWEEVGGKWYYFGESGAMQTGWVEDEGAWYYLAGDGTMQTGWIQYGGARYRMGSDGAMQTGWVQDGGRWYWFTSGGSMATGWTEISGQWEMFDANGVWLYTWDGQ